jgi:ketosteroid isomerase-like protein
MLRHALALAFVLAAGSVPALADPADEVIAAYRAFADAQNARDDARIRAAFANRPDVLWVSDGRSYTGADTIVARMSGFQRAEVWRVEPGLEEARVVLLDDGASLLHMPLTLVIGRADNPDRLPWLVSILFVREATDWKIAALLTTAAK